MIKNLYLMLKCTMTKHVYVDGGSCPFTGKTYRTCNKCFMSVEA
jgi:hypothetical protein